jgi:hypothetical protein
MICPFCNTHNRDDQDTCYHCSKDLTMLRLIVNKAKHHYNLALEHAERNRYYEAITELQNALDLDRQYVDARVFLGTFYAKQNNLEKAAAEWEAALATDNRFYKAHQYLRKAQEIGGALPLFKWVRVLGVALIAAVVCIIALVIYYNSINPNSVLLREAFAHYQGNNYGQALAELGQIEKRAADENLLLPAMILQDHITKTLSDQVTALQDLLANRNYLEALEAAQNVQSVNPDKETSALVAELREQAKSKALQDIDQLFQQWQKSGTGYDELTTESQKLIALLGNDPEAQQLKERVVQVQEQRLERAFENLQKQYKQTAEMKTALAEAAKLLDANPGSSLRGNIQRFMDNIRMNSIESLLATAKQQIEQHAFDKAGATLERIKQSPNLSKELREELATVKAIYDSERATDIVQHLKSLNAKKEYDKVIKLAGQVKEYNLTTEDRKTVEEEIASARRHYAIELYNWMLDRDPKFEECRISEEEAKKTIDTYPMVLDYLPQKAYSYAFDEVTFYIGSAFMRLGQYDKGKEFFRKLRDEYASSPYNKDAEFVLKKFKLSL